MPNTRVTANAGHGFSGRFRDFDFVNNVLMTFAAGVLRDAPAAVFHLDGFVKFVRGERKRMEESVIRFRKIFRNDSRRRMTVVARRDRAMAGLYPTVQVVLHDVAIGAGLGIVAEIRRAFGVGERVTADAHRQTERERNHHGKRHRHLVRWFYRTVWPHRLHYSESHEARLDKRLITGVGMAMVSPIWPSRAVAKTHDKKGQRSTVRSDSRASAQAVQNSGR